MKQSLPQRIIRFIVLFLFFVVIFYPIFLVVLSSFKENRQILIDTFGLPKHLSLDNFSTAFQKGNMAIYFKNSLINTSLSAAFIVFFSSLVSFVLCRRNCVVSKPLYIIFILGISVPMQVGIVSEYLLLSRLNLLNTNAGMILVYIAYHLSFAVFILYNFFKAIPREIQEAAIVDGCGHLRLYGSIVMPLSTAVLTSIAIFSLVWVWNDFFFPLIFISKAPVKTLPLGLMSFKGEFKTDYGVLFAGVALVSMPLIIAYLVMQRQFIEGMTLGAIKG
jgi:raffinose/stachyose/melibiose transport system permease protein